MTNIAKEYIDFSGECIYQYVRLIMGNKISKINFKKILNNYNGVRYYNYFSSMSKTLNGNINYYLKEKIDELYAEFSPQKRNDLIATLRQIFYLDNIHIDQIDGSLLTISPYLNLEEKEEIIKELNRLLKSNIQRKKKFLDEFKSDVFTLEYIRTSNRKVSIVNLNYEIKFPILYSEIAIRGVYNSGVIDEQRLFIEYNLIAVKIMKEIINNDFSSKYIVDFPYSIFEKKAKKNRLFNIVDNDAIKDKLIIKMDYLNYEMNENQVVEMLQNGFKMAIEIDENFNKTKTSIRKLEIFEYIIINNEAPKELEDLIDKLIIVRK